MTSLVVVASSPSLGLWLSQSVLEVTELRPAGLVGWLQDSPEADVFVVSLDSWESVVDRVREIREYGLTAPVLALAPSWPPESQTRVAEVPALHAVSLPLGGRDLAARIQQVIDAGHADPDKLPAPAPAPAPLDEPADASDGEDAISTLLELHGDEATLIEAADVLRSRAGDLHSPAELARAVVDDALRRCGAGAAAVLADDASVVLALGPEGVADPLPLPRWLVHGLTDAVVPRTLDLDHRHRMGDHPWQPHKDLMAVAMPGAGDLLLMGSGSEAFDETSRRAAGDLAAEADVMLTLAASLAALGASLQQLVVDVRLPGQRQPGGVPVTDEVGTS